MKYHKVVLNISILLRNIEIHGIIIIFLLSHNLKTNFIKFLKYFPSYIHFIEKPEKFNSEIFVLWNNFIELIFNILLTFLTISENYSNHISFIKKFRNVYDILEVLFWNYSFYHIIWKLNFIQFLKIFSFIHSIYWKLSKYCFSDSILGNNFGELIFNIFTV